MGRASTLTLNLLCSETMAGSKEQQSSAHIPTSLKAWHTLSQLAGDLKNRLSIEGKHHSRLNKGGDGSSAIRTLAVGSLTLDFSHQHVSPPVLAALQELADQCDLKNQIQRQFRGERVNVTEDRAVLHTALRAPFELCPEEVKAEVDVERNKLLDLAARLRHGSWCGYTGRSIDTLVHIGIGGSNLGPQFACDALEEFNNSGIDIRFLSSIDGHQLDRILAELDAETTLFVIVSKSFTTRETQHNAVSVRSWFLERSGSIEAIEKHFIAVSSNLSEVSRFGIPECNTFAMWDWIGGRFSVWSSAGLPLAIMLGEEHYLAFLNGAHSIDRHVTSSKTTGNAPALLALLAIWNSNFLAAESHAVLAYDHRLKLLPAHLQQVEMESNGKSVHNDGQACEISTGNVLWGGEEPQGQHAYHQLLHQGTRRFSADFITCIAADHRHSDHHAWLLANCLSQSQALFQGQSVAALKNDPLAAHKALPGNHASTTILLNRLTPQALGELLALYEHKVMCLGIILDIDAWDQWGVELGKSLAGSIYHDLTNKLAASEKTAEGETDLISIIVNNTGE